MADLGKTLNELFELNEDENFIKIILKFLLLPVS